MISVLLVDDQPLLRMALGMVLEAHDDLSVCGEAGDGAAAVELTAQLNPDVVLLDIRMPVMDGIEATRQIVATHNLSCAPADHIRPGRIRVGRAPSRGKRLPAKAR